VPPALLILADGRQRLRKEGGEGSLITCINGFPGGEDLYLCSPDHLQRREDRP
jgi:hypothetical protein